MQQAKGGLAEKKHSIYILNLHHQASWYNVCIFDIRQFIYGKHNNYRRSKAFLRLGCDRIVNIKVPVVLGVSISHTTKPYPTTPYMSSYPIHPIVRDYHLLMCDFLSIRFVSNSFFRANSWVPTKVLLSWIGWFEYLHEYFNHGYPILYWLVNDVVAINPICGNYI